MKTNKNIDRLFQEKLKDFEISPPKDTWKKIESTMQNSDSKPLFPLWFSIGSAAVVLILLTIGGINFFNTSPDNHQVNPIVVEEPEKAMPTTQDPKNPTDKINVNKNDVVISIEPQNDPVSLEENNPKSHSTLVKSNKIKPKDILKNNNHISSADNSQFNKKEELKEIQKSSSTHYISNNTNSKSTSKDAQANSPADKSNIAISHNEPLPNSTGDDKEKNIKEENTTIVVKQEDNTMEKIEDLIDDDEVSNKWSVATIFGPVFFNSFTPESSLIDASFIPNENQINNSLSAGIKIGYKINKKLSLQSGLGIINVNSHTSNVYLENSINPKHLSAIDYAPLAESTTISAQPNATSSLAKKEVDNSNSFKGILNQEFGYIEVPMELKYNLTDGKVGLNLVGGFSTLILSKNNIRYENTDFTTEIGKANNLNNINFSGNLGLDVDYKVNDHLFLNLSPMIKVHTNTFSSNSGNFKPYAVGIYSGINYKF